MIVALSCLCSSPLFLFAYHEHVVVATVQVHRLVRLIVIAYLQYERRRARCRVAQRLREVQPERDGEAVGDRHR